MIADSHSTATTATTAPNRAASNALTILRGIGFRYLLFAVSLAEASPSYLAWRCSRCCRWPSPGCGKMYAHR